MKNPDFCSKKSHRGDFGELQEPSIYAGFSYLQKKGVTGVTKRKKKFVTPGSPYFTGLRGGCDSCTTFFKVNYRKKYIIYKNKSSNLFCK